MLSGNYGEENEAMKLFARILAAFLAGVVGLSLVSCSGGKNKDIEGEEKRAASRMAGKNR